MRTDSKKRVLQIAGSIAAAVVLLILFFRQVSVSELLQSLGQIRFFPLLAAIGLALASYTARAFRWGLILKPTGHARFGSLLGCTAAGFATSSLLPARLGEVVRPLLLTSRTGLAASATLASIVAERLLDLLTVLGLALVAAIGRWEGQKRIVVSLLGTAAAVALLLVGLVALVRHHQRLLRFLTPRIKGRWAQRALRFAGKVLGSLAFWGKPSHAANLGVWSIITWSLAIAQVAVTAHSFGLNLSPKQATLVLAISVVGLAVPTPGGIGGFHAAVQFALVHVAGWSMATATGYALIHHAVCFFPVTFVGIGYMLAVGASWRKLGEQASPKS